LSDQQTPRLVWINGAFGVGKSSVGRALQKRWSGSLLFDPEQIGLFLRKVVPQELHKGDFQDIPLWRQLTLHTVSGLMEQYRRPVIVPMTLAEHRYFDEIVGELRQRWRDVYHFTLSASADTLQRRLWRRWVRPLSRRWAVQQIDRCVSALEAPEFAVHIPTDNLRLQEVVREVMSRLPHMNTQTIVVE